MPVGMILHGPSGSLAFAGMEQLAVATAVAVLSLTVHLVKVRTTFSVCVVVPPSCVVIWALVTLAVLVLLFCTVEVVVAVEVAAESQQGKRASKLVPTHKTPLMLTALLQYMAQRLSQ